MGGALHVQLRHPRLEGVPERVLPIVEGEDGLLVAGRGEGVQLPLRIDDPYISRRHFTIGLHEDALWLQNHSRNGTLVNGEIVRDQPARLSGQGDRIEIGQLRIDLTLRRAAPKRDSLIGQTYGGYTIEAELPAGVFGRRYRAVQALMGRTVDLQLVEANLLDVQPGMVERFFRTARLAAIVDHPHALLVHDVGELPELRAFYMAVEYVADEPLASQVDGPMPLADALRIVRQIGSALQQAHQQDVVHRQVSLHTILLGEHGEAKLAGVGLARALEVSATMLTRGELKLAKMLYLAPEQVLDVGAADQRADVYSLAAVCYHLVTGRPPLEARTPMELVRRLIDEGQRPPLPSAVVPSLSGDVDRALMAGLRADRDERPATVEAFLALLAPIDGPASVDRRTLARARRNYLAMLPRQPAIEGVDFAAYCAPMEDVGGDFYDVFEMRGQRWGLVQGDVSGHGIDAAMVVGMAKTAVRIHGQLEGSPARALGSVNQLVRPQLAAGSFFTCCLGVLDAAQLIFTFARGGHNPVLLHNPNRREPTTLLEPVGSALGMLPDRAFTQEEHVLNLLRGDLVLIFSDGATEAASASEADEYFEVDGLRRVVEGLPADTSAQGVIDAIVAELDRYTGGTPIDDDVTLIAFRVTAEHIPSRQTVGIPKTRV